MLVKILLVLLIVKMVISEIEVFSQDKNFFNGYVKKDCIFLAWSYKEFKFKGFNVYRKKTTDKEFTKLTPYLIPKDITSEKIKDDLGDDYNILLEELGAKTADDMIEKFKEHKDKERLALSYLPLFQLLTDVYIYLDRNVEKGAIYEYRLSYIDKNDKEIMLKDIIKIRADQIISPPKVRNVTSYPAHTRMKLKWKQVEVKTEDHLFALKGYNIYRSTKPDEKFEKVGFIFATQEKKEESFIDFGLTNGITYYYKICAVNIVGNEGECSDIVSATPKEGIFEKKDVSLLRAYPKKDAIFLMWKGLEFEYKGFNIYRRKIKDKDFVKINSYLIPREITPDKIKDDLGEDFQGLLHKLKATPDEIIIKFNQHEYKESLAIVYFPLLQLIEKVYMWFDRDIERDAVYEYKLSCIDKNGTEIVLDEGITIKADNVISPPKVKNLTLDVTQNQVTLKWAEVDVKIDDHLLALKGYNVYRTTQKDKKWERVGFILKDEDRKEKFFVDANLINGITYYYKIAAVNMIGNEGEYSDIVEGTPKDWTPPDNPTGLNVTLKERDVELSWKLNLEEDLFCYNVYRSTKIDEDYIKINKEPVSKDTPYYIDSNLKPTTYYYRISAVDLSGNESQMSAASSVTIPNRDLPLPVYGISARSEKQGEVILTWHGSKEEDLGAYGIFRGITKDALTEIATVKTEKCEFVDRALPEGATFYYSVAAVNTSFLRSEIREVVEITTIDKTPPLSPVGLFVEEQEDKLKVTWVENREVDLDSYYLYKKEEDKEDFVVIKTILKDEITQYIDENVKKGKTYYYTVSAKDKFGNISERAQPVSGRIVDYVPPLVPQNFTAYLLKKNLIFVWDENKEDDLFGYNIYIFDEKKGEYILLNKEPIKENIYIEKFEGKTSTYKISAIDTSGNESNKSPNIYPTDKKIPDEIMNKLKEKGIEY